MSKLAERLQGQTIGAIAPSPQQDAGTAVPEETAHQVEQEVRRRLMATPRLKIESLVVRRVDQGICLQGVVESQEANHDICTLVRTVAGVNRVINRLLVASKH